jgi:hypothetical protein
MGGAPVVTTPGATGAAFPLHEPSLLLCANDRESRVRDPGCSLRRPARVPPHPYEFTHTPLR